MKKVIFTLVIAAVGLTAGAQDKKSSDKEFKFSIGVEAGLPLGDLKDASSFGIGGSAMGEYAAAENLGLTLSAGYMTFAGKTVESVKGPSLNLIPVLIGGKYHFNDKIYGHAQLGMTFASVKVAGVSASTSAFTYAPTIGFTPSENIDIALKYQAYTKNSSSTSFLGLRVAYVF